MKLNECTPVKGGRFYYVGDAANRSGVGAVEEVLEAFNLRLRFDDGRTWTVPAAAFLPGVARRFMKFETWRAEQAEGQARLVAALAEMQAKRAAR